MLQTIEATIDTKGTIHFNEEIHFDKPIHVLVTILDESKKQIAKGNTDKILALLQSSEFRNRPSYAAEEIEAQINAERNSWD